MALEIISTRPGVYQVGRSDVECLSGVTIIPAKLLQDYFPGGVASYVEHSGVSQHITQLDDFLFVASGSYGYGISNQSILPAAEFERGKDFVNIQIGDSSSGWYRGTRHGKHGALEIRLDPGLVRPSEQLRTKSESGRLKTIGEITASKLGAEDKFKELIAQMDRPLAGSGKRIAQAVEEALYQIFRDRPGILLPKVRHECASAREAIAAVFGRIIHAVDEPWPARRVAARWFKTPKRSQVNPEELRTVLKEFLRDPDTWVRIKAEDALGDEMGLSRRISPLGNACMGLIHALEQEWPNREIERRVSEIQKLFLSTIRRKIAAPEPGTTAWLKDPDLVSRHFVVTSGHAPQSHLHYKIDHEPGWKGTSYLCRRSTGL